MLDRLLFLSTHDLAAIKPNLSPRAQTCGFVGNNDIYGTGIRIGIYSQIIAVWFANYFLLSEAQVLRDSVTIFSIAILIISFLFAADPSSIYAVEAFILLQILAYSCIMGVRAKKSYTILNWRSTIVRKFLNEAVYLCMVCLHVWFWWTGLDRMKKTPCGTYLMYVVRTDMFGWAREVMKVLSVIVLVVTVFDVGVEGLRPIVFLKMKKVNEQFTAAIKEWEELERKTKDELMKRKEIGQSVQGQAQQQHGCSKKPCSTCPSVEEFTLDREQTLVQQSRTHTITSQDQNNVDISPNTISDAPITKLPQGNPSAVTLFKVDLTKTHNHPSFGAIRKVYESEIHLQHCISSAPYQHGKRERLNMRFSFTASVLFHNTCTLYNHTPRISSRAIVTKWLFCHFHIWKSLITFRFPARCLAVYSHIQAARLMDPINGPFQIYTALTYAPAQDSSSQSHPYTPPSWTSISLASSLILIRSSSPTKVWLFWYFAFLDLAIHIVMILQLELTLVWNRVEGLSNLWNSVGQLIPFIIGVGGLSLVGSRWIAKKWEKMRGKKSLEKETGWLEERLDERELFGLDKDVVGAYERWKQEFERDSYTVQEVV